MVKTDNKLMSIGEVAKSLNITRRIILNYEVYSNYPNKAYYNNYATIQIIL